MKTSYPIVLLFLRLLVAPDTRAQSLVTSDDFNSPVLNLELWSFLNSGQASLSMTGTGSGKAHATIHVPALGAETKVAHYGFPRVMQQANDANVELEVKFEGAFDKMGAGEGIVFEQDSGRFVKITFTRQFAGIRLTAHTWAGGTPAVFYDTAVGASPTRFLRVRRTGNSWDLFWSLDGVVWRPGTTAEFVLALHAVGFLAENNGAEDFSSSIDYFFNTERRIDPEDLFFGPLVLAHPPDADVPPGETAGFTVLVEAPMPVQYQWYRNGAPVSGGTGPTLLVHSVTRTDSGSRFACFVWNDYGGTVTDTALLHVRALAPSISSQPRDTTVTVGQTAFFSIVASGTSPLGYQWQKNAVNIPGATFSSYPTPPTTMADSGALFRCVVTNATGTAISANALLRVMPLHSPPNITLHPRGRTVAPGQRHRLEVVATGTAPLNYQWQRNGASITGANQAAYITPPLTLDDNNTLYRCVVSNSGGSITSDTARVRIVTPDAPGARVPFRYVLIDRNNPRHPHTTSVGDINLDGFPDIVNASGDGYRDGIFWYRYPEWTKTRIDTGSFSTDQQLGDIDGDGDLDLVIPRGIDLGVSVWWYENPLPNGDPATTPWTRLFIGSALAHDVELHDFDHDGRMDVLVRYNTLTIFFQEPAAQWRSVIINQRQREGTAVGDIDGDGDLDLLINGYWLRNPLPNGNPRTDPWTEYLVDTNWPVDVSAQVADINADGRQDLLLAPSGGFAGRLAWYESANPLTGPWVQHIIKQFTECIHGFKIADVDLDGDRDIIAAEGHYCNDPDNISIFLNEGGTALSWHEQIIGTTGLHNLRITDISSDGDIDVVGSNAHDVVNQHGSPLEMWENLMGFTTAPGVLPGSDRDPKPRRTSAAHTARDREAVPAELALYQNYPNPFNPMTTIQFDLPKAGHVTLRLYSTLGQEVVTLLDEWKNEGRYSVFVHAEGWSSGVYFYRLSAGGLVITRTLTILK